jgi:N-acetylmuramoyl-L-alanine amidase
MPDQNQRPGTGPVGDGDYVVRQGDCMESIAHRYGFFWETLWNDAGNRALKETRKDPNALLPGDRVHIPDKRRREETGATDQRHRFRRLGVPSELYLVLKDEDDEPRSGVNYSISIDGRHESGTTNADGEVRHAIPPDARKCILRIGDGEDAEEYEVAIGHIDPITENSGVRGRLANLGYLPPGEAGGDDPPPEAAVRAFQEKAGIEPTGIVDEQTQQALEDEHGH